MRIGALRLDTNRWLAWFHRWAGVVLCLLFAVWFISGAVLHYVGFPDLPARDQLARAEVIDLSRFRVNPERALARIPQATELRLISVAGRPVYVGHSEAGPAIAITADTGETLAPIAPSVAVITAERFAHAAALTVDGPMDYDQWIVGQRFDPFRPFYRVRLNDARRTDLYVSSRTGEVLQRTRFSERAWNLVGAVVHWIYFTPLRKNWSAWDQTVWWISLVALLSSAVGTWLGIIRFASNKRAGRKGLSPFRSWMRWHHIIGLFASIVVIFWIFSGWLSMDHGRLFSHSTATADEVTGMRGESIAGIARTVTPASLRAVSPATQIVLGAVNGKPFLIAYGPHGRAPRVEFTDSPGGTVLESVPAPMLIAGAERVWPGAVRVASSADEFDELYRRAESVHDDAAVFTAGVNGALRVYVDRNSGEILAVMDPSRRVYAWVYYALHTLQFPGLINHAALRALVVLVLLAFGLAFTATGIILAVQRVKRDLRRTFS